MPALIRMDGGAVGCTKVNLSKYKELENQWAKAIDKGKKVSVNVKINYSDNSMRPSSFDIEEIVDGVYRVIKLKN